MFFLSSSRMSRVSIDCVYRARRHVGLGWLNRCVHLWSFRFDLSPATSLPSCVCLMSVCRFVCSPLLLLLLFCLYFLFVLSSVASSWSKKFCTFRSKRLNGHWYSHTNTQCQLCVCVKKRWAKQNQQATNTEAKCEMAVLDKCYKIAKTPSFDVM